MSAAFDLHWERGKAFYEAGKFAEAAAEWQEAVRLKPGSDTTYINLAYALSAEGYSPEALAAVQAALRLQPNNASLYSYLGYHLTMKANENEDREEWKAAADAYQQAINIDPANSTALYSLGVLHWRLGKKRKAISALKAAVAVHPTDIDMHLKLTEFQAATGQFRDMKRTIDRTNRLPDPEEKIAHYYFDLQRKLWKEMRLALFASVSLAAVLLGVWIWRRQK